MTKAAKTGMKIRRMHHNAILTSVFTYAARQIGKRGVGGNLRQLALVLYVLCGSCFTACALHQSGNQEYIIGQPHHSLDGGIFKHKLWEKSGSFVDKRLHIYIGGDGQPWLAPGKIAIDPTPESSLAWQLMQVDPHPAMFISRPCYYRSEYTQVDQASDSECHPRYWTSERYSAEVVASLSNAILKALDTSSATEVWLVGYSGGGALAMLVAANPELKHTLTGVITLSANLDIDAWTDIHGYSALQGSLNPAHLPAQSELRQYHYVGERDENTPVVINQRFYQNQGVEPRVIAQKNHDCCWLALWPNLLEVP